MRHACLVLALALAACGAGARTYVSRPGPYDELDRALLAWVHEARLGLESGRLAGARVALSSLQREAPQNLAVAVLLQDVELEILEAGGELPFLAPVPGESPREQLRAHYQAKASRFPSAFHHVLAARLETDLPSAALTLERAVAADPRCIWAHYGKANVAIRSGDYETGVAALERALSLDSGHLPTRRLETRILAQSGSYAIAADALRAWLRDSEESPFVDSAARRDAMLDLATVHLLRGHADRARDVLDGLDDASRGRSPRAFQILAAAEQSSERFAEAMSAAGRAEELDPSDPLSALQQALLADLWMDDDTLAVERWKHLLEVLERGSSEESGTQQAARALLLGTQARVHLQRLEAEEGP